MSSPETELPRQPNDTVVRELYEAAAGLVPWPKALDGLFAELKVRQMQLLTVDKTNGILVRSDQPAHMDSIVFDAILEYVREYHRFDPHLAYTGSMPVGAVVNTANVFPIEEYKKHPFYRDYWAAFDVRELLAAKVAEDERYVVMLGMSRTHDLPAYTPADMALLERYVGHLAAAYRIVKHLGVVQATAQAGLAIIEASARPMVLLGLNQRIIWLSRILLPSRRNAIRRGVPSGLPVSSASWSASNARCSSAEAFDPRQQSISSFSNSIEIGASTRRDRTRNCLIFKEAASLQEGGRKHSVSKGYRCHPL
jgi:hypothetical protein